MYYLFCIPVLLILFHLFCLKGRTGQPKLAELKKWNYAHRGLHNDKLPENSLGAFKNAVAHNFGAELDIHLMKDGRLAVIHDSCLKRVAGADVNIEDLTAEDLEKYPLMGTQERIPLFSQVLEVFDGKQPLIIELKTANGNHAALCEAACKMLDEYKGLYCIESFDPRCIMWLRRHRPDIVRGQLSENWFKSKSSLPWVFKFVLAFHGSNLLTRPDFIAYKYADRHTFGTNICRKLWKVQGVSWTLRTKEEYDTAVSEGWIPIFENFIP